MTETAQFTDDQFLTATALNRALQSADTFGTALASGALQQGLIRPDVLTFGVTGLAVATTAGAPFAIQFLDGVISMAHGTVDGQDTQSYLNNFTPPASGSQTFYLVAEYASLQQDPYQVIGPPPGHPDFNPNFQPYTAYAKQVDSFSLLVTTTAPDTVNNFEIFRTVLAAGATGLAPNTAYQYRAAGNNVLAPLFNASFTAVPLEWNGTNQNLEGAGPYTLPAVVAANGLRFWFTNIASQSIEVGTDQTVDTPDEIFGTEPYPDLGAPAFLVEPGQNVSLVGQNGAWQILTGDPYMSIVVPGVWSRQTGSGNFVVGSDCPANVRYLQVEVGGGGAGGASCMASGSNTINGGAGGAGGYAFSIVNVFNGQSIPWAVGAGGTGGASGGFSGNNGGESNFGTIDATGGTGGEFVASSGALAGGGGGIGVGGQINLIGGDGEDGNTFLTSQEAGGGMGGASFFGGGSRGYVGGGGAPSPAAPSSGGGSSYSNPNFPGANGAAGIVKVKWGI